MKLSGLATPAILAAVVIHILCTIGFTLVMEMEIHSLSWLFGTNKGENKNKIISGDKPETNENFRAKNMVMNPLDTVVMNNTNNNGIEETKLIVRIQQNNTEININTSDNSTTSTPTNDPIFNSFTATPTVNSSSSNSPPKPNKSKTSSLGTSHSTVGRNLFFIGTLLVLILDSTIITSIIEAKTSSLLSLVNSGLTNTLQQNRTVTGDLSPWITNSSTGNRRILQTTNDTTPINATYSYQNITNGKYPGGDTSLCFHMYKYEIPPVPTSYSCRAFAFPNDIELHAVEFIPLIDNAAVTHHLLLLAVDYDYTKTYAGYNLDSRGVFDCANLPVTQGPLFVWAVGSQNLVLPSNVGTRVGSVTGSTSGSYKYAILQVHYSNPSGTRGIYDSSGVLIRVTNKTRTYDSGLLMIGAPVDNSVVIPPNKTAYGIQSHLVIPNTLATPRNIFAVMYHAHTLGKRVWTDLIKGGNQLITGANDLGRDDPFDFGMQRYLPLNASIVARDVLRTRCVFENTVARGIMGGNTEASLGHPVYGGEGTTQEMCMSFLFYYPRIPVAALPTSVILNKSSTFCDDDSLVGLPKCSTF